MRQQLDAQLKYYDERLQVCMWKCFAWWWGLLMVLLLALQLITDSFEWPQKQAILRCINLMRIEHSTSRIVSQLLLPPPTG